MTAELRRHRLGAAVAMATLLAAACAIDDGADVTSSPRSSDAADAAATTTTIDPCLTPDPEASRCGIPFDELRQLNLRHADRLEFSGNLEAAYAIAVTVEERMQSLLATTESPTVDQVEEALQGVGGHVTASSEAVRASGVGFAVQVDGGCVFGDVGHGTFDVDIGGYVNDGGCLALYGH